MNFAAGSRDVGPSGRYSPADHLFVLMLSSSICAAMRFGAFVLVTVFLASCATKPEEAAAAPTPPAASTKPADEAPPEAAVAEPQAPEDLGLLEPQNLLTLPSDQDMKPTVEPKREGGSALIATPPSD